MIRKKTLLVSLAALALCVHTAWADDTLEKYVTSEVLTDVTETYLSNPSFESDDTSSLTEVTNTGDGLRGWTLTSPTDWTVSGSTSVTTLLVSDTCYTDNNFGLVTTVADSTYAYYLRMGWSTGTTTLTQTTQALPAGTYRLTMDYRSAYTNSATSSFVLSADDTSASSVTFTAGSTSCFTTMDWSTGSVDFTLSDSSTVNITVKVTWVSGGSCIMMDNFRLYTVEVDTDTVVYYNISDCLLSNANFSEGDALEEGVCTYNYDMSKNGVEHFGLQEVDGWTANSPTDNTYIDGSSITDADARAGGVYAYGSTAWLGSSGYCPPSTDPDGSSDGQCLGIVSVWGATSYYQSDSITLPAGSYIIYIPTYNSAGTGSITNYTGFVSSDGSITQYCTSTTYTVGEWTTDSVEFTLTTAVTGHFQFGFKSGNGSGSTPHLFYDGMTVYSTAEAGVGVTTIDPAYDADANALGTATVTFRSWNSDDTAAGALIDQLTLALIAGTDTTSYTLTASADEAGVYTADLSNASLEYETEYTLSIAAGIYGYSEDLTNCAASTTFTTICPDSITLSIGTSGWTSTYYGSYNLTVPDGVTAYTVEVQDGDTVTALASPISGSVIPKGTAVLLQGTANTTYAFAIAESADSLSATNDLKGSDGAKVIASSDSGNYYYKFSLDSENSDGSIGFYWQASDGHSYTATAHKAYLVIAATTTSEAKAVTFVVDGQTTAITSVNTDAAQTAQGIYTLTGVKLNADIEALPAGLYIINGQKTLIR